MNPKLLYYWSTLLCRLFIQCFFFLKFFTLKCSQYTRSGGQDAKINLFWYCVKVITIISQPLDLVNFKLIVQTFLSFFISFIFFLLFFLTYPFSSLLLFLPFLFLSSPLLFHPPFNFGTDLLFSFSPSFLASYCCSSALTSSPPPSKKKKNMQPQFIEEVDACHCWEGEFLILTAQ